MLLGKKLNNVCKHLCEFVCMPHCVIQNNKLITEAFRGGNRVAERQGKHILSLLIGTMCLC